jgi:hypothetical protein
VGGDKEAWPLQGEAPVRPRNDGPARRCPCGDVVPEDRWSAGYHYCKKPACWRRWGKRQTVRALAVNKSMDAIVDVDSRKPAPAPPENY